MSEADFVSELTSVIDQSIPAPVDADPEQDVEAVEPDSSGDAVLGQAEESVESTEPTESTAEPEADASHSFFDLVKNDYGYDLSSKYSDPDAAMRGMVEAMKLVGKRDEDAILGRQLRENPQSVLSQYQQYQQQQQPQQQPAAPVDDFKPLTRGEMRWVQEKMAADPGSVEQGIIDRYNATTERMAEALEQLAFHRDDFLAPALTAAQIAAQQAAEGITQRQAFERNRELQMAQWRQKNADFLFSPDGNWSQNATTWAAAMEEPDPQTGQSLFQLYNQGLMGWDQAADLGRVKSLFASGQVAPVQAQPAPASVSVQPPPKKAEMRPNVVTTTPDTNMADRQPNETFEAFLARRFAEENPQLR